MAEGIALQARGLAKHYGEVRAVDGIDLDVRAGEVYAFLGRNGAGKTTTIRMLLGLIAPTAGEVRLLGAPLVPSGPQLAHVGYLVETATAYPNLTVRENLDVQRRLTGTAPAAVERAIKLMRLGEYAGRRAGQLSLGNKQRLALARALLHEPSVVILDEPANALDPAGIVEIRELLRALADDRGVTVFLSSHILTEVAHLADRVGVIHEGRMVAELDRAQLEARTRAYVTVEVSDAPAARRVLADRLGIEAEERDGALRLFGALDRRSEVARELVSAGFELRTLAPAEEDLEDFFMRLTGGEA